MKEARKKYLGEQPTDTAHDQLTPSVAIIKQNFLKSPVKRFTD